MCTLKNAIKISAGIVSILLIFSSCQSAKEEISSDSYNQSQKIEIQEDALEGASEIEGTSEEQETFCAPF